MKEGVGEKEDDGGRVGVTEGGDKGVLFVWLAWQLPAWCLCRNELTSALA